MINKEKLKNLNYEYKKNCIEKTKKELIDKIGNFIDDDSIDKNYKDKILNMIFSLLELK